MKQKITLNSKENESVIKKPPNKSPGPESFPEVFCLVFVLFFFFLLPGHTTCGILVLQPGTEPVAPALEVPLHW